MIKVKADGKSLKLKCYDELNERTYTHDLWGIIELANYLKEKGYPTTTPIRIESEKTDDKNSS